MAIGVGVLVAVVWIATLLIANPQPPTKEEAAAKIEEHFDRIEGSLSAGSILDRSEEIAEEACPLEGLGDQTRVQRVLYVAPDLDRIAWATTLREVFTEADGWAVRVKTLDSRENLGIRIAGRDLTVISITATDASGDARVTLLSTSECSRTS